MIVLDRYTRTPDDARHREVGAFAQDVGLQQRGHLAVHRGDAELGGLGDGVASHRPAQAHGTEHRCGGRFGHLERRDDDLR